MIRVSVMYPSRGSSRFDVGYYFGTHIPMIRALLGTPLKGATVDEGLGGMQPGEPPTYRMMTHLLFESIESFQAAIAPHLQTIIGDIATFTDVEPVVQISAVRA
jgi:uncharacterized protein (TIGR02118 family)